MYTAMQCRSINDMDNNEKCEKKLFGSIRSIRNCQVLCATCGLLYRNGNETKLVQKEPLYKKMQIHTITPGLATIADVWQTL